MSEKKETARAILAGNLRELRTEAGLSQEALSRLAGFHRTLVGFVEREERNITLDNLERLALTLRVRTARLLKE